MIGLLPLLLACTDGGGGTELTDLSATLSEDVVTVATVTWTTSAEVSTWLEATLPDGRVITTPAQGGGTSHEQLLLGLPANTDVELVAVAEDGSESAPLSLSTGPLPQSMPSLSGGGDGNDLYAFLPAIGSSTAALVLSPAGEIVWYHPEDRDLDVYRVRPARDGSGVWYNAGSVSGDPSADSVLVKVSWDGGTVEEISVPLLAHDFVELSDGTLTAIVVEYRTGEDGEEIRGDQLVEIAPDGTQTVVWSAWDCFDPETAPGDEPVLGWTFANALDLSADETEYHLGIRNLSSIVRIDRATGACLEVIGGDGADAPGDADAVLIEGEDFHHQHQFELSGDSLLVFDNEGAGPEVSRAIEYSLDRDAGTATEIWRYQPDPPLFSFVLGDVHRTDDGDVMVTWSVAGQLDRVDTDGAASWTLNTDLGSAFGFTDWRASPYVE